MNVKNSNSRLITGEEEKMRNNMLRKGLVIGIILLFAGTSVLPTRMVKATRNIIYVPDDYTTIQAAVDNASANDTIVVRDGTYTENINVNKRLTIQSENGSSNCIVQTISPGGYIFDLGADSVVIKGFTLEGAWDWGSGVYLENVNYCSILDNICINNYNGILLQCFANYSTLKNNNCSGGCHGIHLQQSANNIVINNSCYNNRFNWGDGIMVEGYYSYNNLLKYNSVSGNLHGIHLAHAEYEASNNWIYLNNFVDNDENSWIEQTHITNTWNSTEEIIYSYNGSVYTNYMGNYWDDYTGNDSDGDGIGDASYSIFGVNDYYPLMEPFENYINEVSKGIWINGGQYGHSNNPTTEQYIVTANHFGGINSIIDLVVILARADGTYAEYPSTVADRNESKDLVEPMLEALDESGYHCILSIQPLTTNITDLINEILSRYSHHPCILGVGLDAEWKGPVQPGSVSDAEAESYIDTIQHFQGSYQLFLVHYDISMLPDDRPRMTVLYDGKDDVPTILANYRVWGQKWSSVGIYVFDKSSPIADDVIMETAPNTGYIIHEEYTVLGLGIEIKGGLGVNVNIKNNGDVKAANITWEIYIEGGILQRINKTVNGTIDIPVGESGTVRTGLFFGFGPIAITVKAADEEKIAEGTQFIIFSMVKK